jgi:hypothetical protein
MVVSKEAMSLLIDRAGGLAGLGPAIYILFLPGCICDLWMPTTGMDVEPEDSSALVAKAFAANGESVRVGAYLGLIAVFLLVMFFSRLHGALRDASGPNSWLPNMALAGGILMAGVLLIEIGLGFASSELSSYGEETQVVRFFVLWSWNSANLFAPPFAIALVSTTLVALSARAFPQWYRWASAALLALLLMTSGVLRAPGLALVPGMLWMFLTSLVLALKPNRGLTQTA